MVDVLYSLVGINERLNRLILAPPYIRNLDMTMKSLSDDTSSIPNEVLDRICRKVLPRIHHHVNKLVVEPYSMVHIFFNVNFYPQLFSLSFVNFQEKILYQYLTEGDSILYRLLTEQITDLNINIQNKKTSRCSKPFSNVFVLILSLCKRLINLNFCQLFSDEKLPLLIFDLASTSCMSSTLTQLKINVKTFDACLYLLDGRLDCLSTLVINVSKISRTLSNADNMKKILKLKYFSLTSPNYTFHYDNGIIPLLRRMINLEELILFLAVIRVDLSYIDGTHLYDEIQLYMPRLNKLTFSINTGVIKKNINFDFPSNEDIQRNFVERGYQQVGLYVDSSLIEDEGRCHVYSLPYQFETFLHLNNSFSGGVFDKVKYLLMTDGRPFEHEFFKIISQVFPFLKKLRICNDQPQKHKQHSSTLITFSHLTYLNLKLAHVDYAKQFLLKKNTHLPCLLELAIKYNSLTRVTNNFTNNAVRLNCSKLKHLHIKQSYVRPSNFHEYFPSL